MPYLPNFFRLRLLKKIVNHQNKSPNSYEPGCCNIGLNEINVRKKFLMLFLPLSLILSIGSYFMPESKILWLVLIACSFSAIVLYSEIKNKFCVIFGFFNLYNFKKLGNLDHVEDVHKKQLDRRRVLKVLISSLFFALIYSTSVHYLVLTFH